MKTIGIICADVITKNRIMAEIEKQKFEAIVIHSAAKFDPNIFDYFIVDLNSPSALLVLGESSRRSFAFSTDGNSKLMVKAKQLGCERVYKPGEFFKNVLPNFQAFIHGRF